MKDGPTLGGMARGLWFAYQAANAIEDRTRQKKQIAEAEKRLRQIEEGETSGKLQDARLGAFSDIQQAGLLEPSGLFLGLFDDQNGQSHLIFHNKKSPALTYGYTGSGKGRDIILANLAHLKNSVFVTDPKGELAYATGGHRRQMIGGRSIYANPWKMENLPRHKINPLQRLIHSASAGQSIIDEAYEFVSIFMPATNQSGGDNAWVRDVVEELLHLRLVYTAKYEPENCTPGGLWDFFNGGKSGCASELKKIASIGDPFLTPIATSLLEGYPPEEEQLGWVLKDGSKFVKLYGPGMALREATSKSDFDLRDLKRSPHTVYLMIPGGKLESHAQWLSLMANAAMETVANTSGPIRTTFILDEFGNLPKMPAALKALKLYRDAGVQLWPILQGRQALVERYGQSGMKEFEEQAGVWQMWGIGEDDQLCRQIEHQAGYKSVVINSRSYSVQGSNLTGNEQITPILPASEIRKIDQGRQILSVKGGYPLFIARRVPWWEIEPWNKRIRNPHGRHS